jgi:hypothetical protein
MLKKVTMRLFSCFRVAAAPILVVAVVLGTLTAASATEIVVFAAATREKTFS